ncbi:MAG: hypothetical protein ACE5IR_15165 [bacterium]
MRKKNKQFAPFKSPVWSLVEKPESKLNSQTRNYFSKSVKMNQLVKGKAAKVDIKRQHRKIYELSLIFVFTLLIVVVQLARQFSLAAQPLKSSDIKILVADIPVTEQLRRPPKPVRPSVPIPTDEEAIPEDLTIASTELDLSEIPPPPVPPSEEDELAIFVAYTEAPEIIGGSRELFKHLKYPLLAEKAGVEGTVFVNVLVGVSGKTEVCKNVCHLCIVYSVTPDRVNNKPGGKDAIL